MIVKSYKRNP